MKQLRKPGNIILLLVLLISSACSPRIQSGKASGIKLSALYITAPLLKAKNYNQAVQIRIYVPEGKTINYKSIQIDLDQHAINALEKIDVLVPADHGRNFPATAKTIGSSAVLSEKLNIPVDLQLKAGLYTIWLSPVVKSSADMDQQIRLKVNGFTDGFSLQHKISRSAGSAGGEAVYFKRIALALRKAGDDGVHSYRIPGIATTDKGTLLSVYDIRYKHSGDLPANIDVGLSRSTDGGSTWEPMKIIMDMGEPHQNNGVGDPAILFDPVTKKIWVAALWSKGNRSIAGSEPGLSPDITGQLVLVSSDDDGITWSKPYSITNQVKDPKWHLYFNGPGNGIAMKNGTLVFPSQYWDESTKPGIPHSSIIYSDDHGKTWKSGIGAKINTTESQVVETEPGILMLNMRDNRGKFRSVATTKDMGATWLEHQTSYEALPDPVCMASLIKARVMVKGKMQDVLFFSNVATQTTRKNMTIKASLDLGETWLPAHELLLDERLTYGYSTLTKIDDQTLGLLYEGERDLYFIRVPVADIFK